MACRLGSCSASLAVAAVTLTRTVGFVDPCATEEGCRGMALRTVPRCWPVSRIGLGVHTCCGITIMAGCAIIHHTGMIKYCAGEATGVMSEATILTGWYMSSVFACGEAGVMT